MTQLPGGTVTLLFADIEGSTGLLQVLGDRYGVLLAEHNRLLRGAFADEGGLEVDSAGDGLFYTFPSARAGLLGAIEAQRRIAAGDWPGSARRGMAGRSSSRRRAATCSRTTCRPRSPVKPASGRAPRATSEQAPHSTR